MQSKGQTAAKVIGIVLVLLLLAGIVAVIYRFTNGFNEEFKTFYVEHDGEQILSADSKMSFKAGETYRFDVKYTFDTDKSETKDYSVTIIPNAEKDFEYTVDGEPYLYSKAGDLSAAFGLRKHDMYFEIVTAEDTGLTGVLKSKYSGQTVEIPENAASENPYPFKLVISSYNESVTYNIRFNVGVDVTGVTLDPSEIIFTGSQE